MSKVRLKDKVRCRTIEAVVDGAGGKVPLSTFRSLKSFIFFGTPTFSFSASTCARASLVLVFSAFASLISRIVRSMVALDCCNNSAACSRASSKICNRSFLAFAKRSSYSAIFASSSFSR